MKTRCWLTRGFLLLQDNAPAHTTQIALANATKCSFKIFPHLLYSPDLALSDFYLFPNLTATLRRRNIGSNRAMMLLVCTWGTRTKGSFLKG